MKCWISNGFHRESQFRLPRPPYARSSSSISDPLKCLCSRKTGLAQSQVGGSLGTPWCIPPSLQVFCDPKLLPLSWTSFGRCYPFWGLSILWNLPRLLVGVLGPFQWVPSLPHIISTILDFLSAAFLTSVHSCAFPLLAPIRKMLHLLGIIKFTKCITYNFSQFKQVHAFLASQQVSLAFIFFQLP